jgi:paraquat-inducible protein A
VTRSALDSGYLRCPLCSRVNLAAQARCVRCGTPLEARKPYSIARTWALVFSAYLLYIPANLLPVLETTSVGGTSTDTILSGVLQLASDGAWPLALVIFVASIAVPLAKLLALSLLLASVQAGAEGHRQARTRVARVLEAIGRWSMIDIFVGALLVTIVRFEPLAAISPGPGAIAFGAVVVLTVMASRSFDPRLIWDAQPQRASLPEPARG